MKKLSYLLLLIFAVSFGQENEFNDYWYGGEAEITSYTLEQARYGEMRKGTAVHIFVTEPFSKKYMTKADSESADNVNVLKLNAIKKFNTGVYSYSLMTSTFMPIENPRASLKVSASSQEWCGHEYLDLKQEGIKFIVNNYSYYGGKSFVNKLIDNKNVVLEDDIWSLIRLNPGKLPVGNLSVLPSFVYLRFSQVEMKGYTATAELKKEGNYTLYQIKYPELEREISVKFENKFPYTIISWSESYYSGTGNKKKMLTTKAVLKKSLKLPYWNTNNNVDAHLRKELGLE